MASDDWFRNTEWNPDVEAAFEAKLKRARRKGQYLRIQACTLAARNPDVALRLLERYFTLGKDVDLAQAFVDQATAHLAQGNPAAAVESLEKALEREGEFPNLRTIAALELPYQVALAGFTSQFERALDLLKSSAEQLMFPADRFRYHAARALILQKSDAGGARDEARLALEAAASDHSGFRYHPKAGLVSDRHAPALAQLRELCDA